ncbi:hypothetical protein AQUCO_00300908v1 [Aquilegia coerulea]|uniref:DUF3444 domain-containing protein n=1 Tax=Aquilegia coerulea TaxID=218851 RepID=A0A2G5F130_AQUCA|nr:hypothetical protein AQUCO_00300908v1 [Aquilegia coerulea]
MWDAMPQVLCFDQASFLSWVQGEDHMVSRQSLMTKMRLIGSLKICLFSCGNFKHGQSEINEDINMFSHTVNYVKGAHRSLIVIHPRKGQTWALFRNWDIKWSSDPENHRSYEYIVVKILSDYKEVSGITVAKLEKVKGFVSLFSTKKGVAPYRIPPKELYRFSHMIPSYRTTGYERVGVPEGSFELDPASVPAVLVEYDYNDFVGPHRVSGSSTVVGDKSEASLKEKASKTTEPDCFAADIKNRQFNKRRGIAGFGESSRNGNVEAEFCKRNGKDTSLFEDYKNKKCKTEQNRYHEQNQPGPGRSTFWTACPSCKMRYQYYKDILNRALRCQSCMRPFVASDLNVQSVPSGACMQPAIPLQKEVAQSVRKMGLQGTGRDLYSCVGDQVHSDHGTAEPESSPPKGDLNRRATSTQPTVSQPKKVRQNAPTLQPQSSAKDLSFNVVDQGRCDCKTAAAEIFPDKPGTSNVNGESITTAEENGSLTGEDGKQNAKETAPVEDTREASNAAADDPIELSPRKKDLPDPKFIEVVDPEFYFVEVADAEFYVFDDDRKEDCFKKDQIWSIYDNVDAMPRFYALIRQVFSHGFKVKITWLAANPDDKDEIDWVTEDLPVSCGNFKHGQSEINEDINMFSHTVNYVKGAHRSLIVIHPRKGQTWALFRNWDIKWSSDPENHRSYEYIVVKILSDYKEVSGITVAKLEKVKGFVSLFSTKKGVAPYRIPPKELYRFSHMIPSYRTTGYERVGVPEGSFELDPASVPAVLVEYDYNDFVGPHRVSGSSTVVGDKSEASLKEKASKTTEPDCFAADIKNRQFNKRRGIAGFGESSRNEPTRTRSINVLDCMPLL